MKYKWPNRIYIDLFAGPGYNRIRPKGDIIESGPLIAATQKTPFTRCLFVDSAEDSCIALENRFRRISDGRPFDVLRGDCNNAKVITQIIEALDQRSLTVCIIDPTTVNVQFNTIRLLSHNRRMDLLITFPFGMSIIRHVEKWINEECNPLDDFFGNTEWRDIYKRVCLSSSVGYKRRVFTDYYCERLRSIGYKYFDDRIQVRSQAKSTHLYSLIFASKHPKGLAFFLEDSKYVSVGQGKLPY